MSLVSQPRELRQPLLLKTVLFFPTTSSTLFLQPVRVLVFNSSCVIGGTLRDKTANKIASAPYLSFIQDGSTDKSTKECEIIYARIIDDGKPCNILIGHVEVEHAHAEGKECVSFLFHIAK